MPVGLFYARKQCFIIFLVILMSSLVMISQLSQYDLRQHKWLHMYLLDLPAKYQIVYRPDVNIRRLWQPGPEYTFVDIKEPYLKSENGGKTIDTKGSFEILHYNEEANMHAQVDNVVIKDTCAYQNCHFTNNVSRYPASQAVLFSLSHGNRPLESRAPAKLPGQVWIFFDREAPIIQSRIGYRHESWKNVMNWSMTHRLDSDIFFPYGQIVSRKPSEVPKRDYSAIFRQKTKFAFWIVSNCKGMVFSNRNEFVQELQKYIPIDIFGACGTRRVSNEELLELFRTYKFFLSLENSLCRWYVTEKFFERYSEDILLVTRGGADYNQLFPSGTFIDSADFANPASLAQLLLQLNASEKHYTNILRKKDKYNTKPAPSWQCQLCGKLNNQDQHRKVYESIVAYWHVDICWKPSDITSGLSKTRLFLMFMLIIVVIICWSKFRSKRGSHKIIGNANIFHRPS